MSDQAVLANLIIYLSDNYRINCAIAYDLIYLYNSDCRYVLQIGGSEVIYKVSFKLSFKKFKINTEYREPFIFQ